MKYTFEVVTEASVVVELLRPWRSLPLRPSSYSHLSRTGLQVSRLSWQYLRLYTHLSTPYGASHWQSSWPRGPCPSSMSISLPHQGGSRQCRATSQICQGSKKGSTFFLRSWRRWSWTMGSGSNGVRIQLYPKLSPNALVAEHSHALQANKNVMTDNPRIPFKEGFSFVALRPGRLHLSYVFLYPPPSGSKIAHPLDQFYFWNVVTLS